MKSSKWKNIARMTKNFKLRVGSLEAQGVPAIVLSWAGIVLAVGLVRAIDRNATVLPEAFREAKGLLEAIRAERGSAPLASYREA
jgi:hypothetical protein